MLWWFGVIRGDLKPCQVIVKKKKEKKREKKETSEVTVENREGQKVPASVLRIEGRGWAMVLGQKRPSLEGISFQIVLVLKRESLVEGWGLEMDLRCWHVLRCEMREMGIQLSGRSGGKGLGGRF